jgi:hypothetical protein
VFYTANHYDIDAFVPPYNSVGFGVGVGGVGARPRPTEITIEFVVLPWTQYKANEQWHIVKDQTSPGRWHIGLVIEVVDSSNEIAFCVDVLADASSFFRFPMQNAKSYMKNAIKTHACTVDSYALTLRPIWKIPISNHAIFQIDLL